VPLRRGAGNVRVRKDRLIVRQSATLTLASQDTGQIRRSATP